MRRRVTYLFYREWYLEFLNHRTQEQKEPIYGSTDKSLPYSCQPAPKLQACRAGRKQHPGQKTMVRKEPEKKPKESSVTNRYGAAEKGENMKEEVRNKLTGLKINTAKGEEAYGSSYEEKLKQFIGSYDFMRLGQAVNGKRWESAAMCARRMSMEAEQLGLDCFQRQFAGLRQSIARKDIQEVKNLLSLVVVKRVRIQEVLKQS